jgi:hypothetical protein
VDPVTGEICQRASPAAFLHGGSSHGKGDKEGVLPLLAKLVEAVVTRPVLFVHARLRLRPPGPKEALLAGELFAQQPQVLVQDKDGKTAKEGPLAGARVLLTVTSAPTGLGQKGQPPVGFCIDDGSHLQDHTQLGGVGGGAPDGGGGGVGGGGVGGVGGVGVGGGEHLLGAAELADLHSLQEQETSGAPSAAGAAGGEEFALTPRYAGFRVKRQVEMCTHNGVADWAAGEEPLFLRKVTTSLPVYQPAL